MCPIEKIVKRLMESFPSVPLRFEINFGLEPNPVNWNRENEPMTLTNATISLAKKAVLSGPGTELPSYDSMSLMNPSFPADVIPLFDCSEPCDPL